MGSPLRIAILECDELTGEAERQYGRRIGNLYSAFLDAGATRLAESGVYERPALKLSFYDVVNKQEYPDLETTDAIFLTGGRKCFHQDPRNAEPKRS